MTRILFPGRHLVHTEFQKDYLLRALMTPTHQLEIFNCRAFSLPEKLKGQTIDEIVFAVTSANQPESRYNPIPYEKRIIGVERFGSLLKSRFPTLSYRIVGIPDFGRTDRFAELMLKQIAEEIEHEVDINPENTLVLCSTPAVIPLFQRLGYYILPAELRDTDGPAEQDFIREEYRAETPVKLVQRIASLRDKWKSDTDLQKKLCASTISMFDDYLEIPKRIIRLFNDPLRTETGELTATRNYDVYAFGMGNQDIIRVKYNDIKRFIRGGRIADEGCAEGRLLMEVAKDFPDADLIGIDASGEFISRAEEHKRQHKFGNGTFIYFHHRNIMEPIFEASSIDTVICNSTGHEIWSYGDREESVRTYLAEKFRQLKPGGRLVMRDVVGPEDKEQEVYMACDDKDGLNELEFMNIKDPAVVADLLGRLSTCGRFQRFTEDYLTEALAEGKREPESTINYRTTTIKEKSYFVLTLKDAVEFMTKKDYLDNWQSEMNEEFAFWSFSEWKQALADTGFTVLENPNHPEQGSHVYTSKWIRKNRWEGKVELYKRAPNGLQKMEWPVTTMVLVGEKRA
ncbi:MAG: methyltransferase domain-containing protein [Nanoarchaeota archaeon]